jgi:hypothetical protein
MVTLTFVALTQPINPPNAIVPVKSLHLPEGQTGNAWEPSKPMINSVSLALSVSHYHPTSLSLSSLLSHSHRRGNLKSYSRQLTLGQ